MAGQGFPLVQPASGRSRRPGPCVRSRPPRVDKAESGSRLLLVLLLVLRQRLNAAPRPTSWADPARRLRARPQALAEMIQRAAARTQIHARARRRAGPARDPPQWRQAP